jgi:hypothetical protein
MAAKLSQSVFRNHGRAPPIVDAHGGKVDILMNAFIRRQRRNGRHAQREMSRPLSFEAENPPIRLPAISDLTPGETARCPDTSISDRQGNFEASMARTIPGAGAEIKATLLGNFPRFDAAALRLRRIGSSARTT